MLPALRARGPAARQLPAPAPPGRRRAGPVRRRHAAGQAGRRAARPGLVAAQRQRRRGRGLSPPRRRCPDADVLGVAGCGCGPAPDGSETATGWVWKDRRSCPWPTDPHPARRRPGLRPARRRQDGDRRRRWRSTGATTSRWPTRPGVALVCEAIAADPTLTRHYTWVPNTVAVVTDGTAVLGLGDIGPAAAMPVMEGKAVLFKQFGGVDAVPICLDTTDVDEIVETVVRLAPSFGGINLEDISAPRCFEIEERLKQRLDIPVFHDDQHGTAVVALAALENALTLTGRAQGDDPGGDLRRGRGRRRDRQDPARGRHHRHRRHRPQGRRALRSPRPHAGQARARRADRRPHRPHRHPRRRARRRRRLPRRLRRHHPRGGRRPDGARGDHLRDGQPDTRGAPGRRPPLRPGGGHRSLGLPEPDQQRARVPRHLPRAPSTSAPPRSPRA